MLVLVSASPTSSWKRGESVCTTSARSPAASRLNLGANVKKTKKKKEEKEIEGTVEGVPVRDRMHYHGKFSEYMECLGRFVDEWEDLLPWHFFTVSNRKMFRQSISREIWTFGLILLLFAHVICLNVKFLQNNSLTTSNFSVSNTFDSETEDYEWRLMGVASY